MEDGKIRYAIFPSSIFQSSIFLSAAPGGRIAANQLNRQPFYPDAAINESDKRARGHWRTSCADVPITQTRSCKLSLDNPSQFVARL